MTDKEIDKLFEATDKAFAPLGYSGFEIAVREEAPLFAQIADLMKTLSNRDLARRWLRSLPDNEPPNLLSCCLFSQQSCTRFASFPQRQSKSYHMHLAGDPLSQLQNSATRFAKKLVHS